MAKLTTAEMIEAIKGFNATSIIRNDLKQLIK